MGRVLLHDDNDLSAHFDTKACHLDMPAAPLHRQLHEIRLAVERATGSATMNVVVAAVGLIHGSAQHWSTSPANMPFIYQTREPQITPELAAQAKYRAKASTHPYDTGVYQPVRERIKGARSAEARGRVWTSRILPYAFCSGARATHHTPERVALTPGTVPAAVDTIHREQFDAEHYGPMAELFKSVHSVDRRSHFATGDNHSEFHLAYWLHNHFEVLAGLPASLNLLAGVKIYGITLDIVSTNTICRECATKLDALLPPGYLKELARSYYSANYVTTVRDDAADDQRFRPELRFQFRASAARAFSGSPVPEHVVGPIQAKSSFYDGDNLVIHEAMWVPAAR